MPVFIAAANVGLLAGAGYYVGTLQDSDIVQEKEVRVRDDDIEEGASAEEEFIYYVNGDIDIGFSYPVELREVDVSSFDSAAG